MTETPRPTRVLVLDDNPDDRLLVLRELTALWPTVIAIEVNAKILSL